MAAHDNSFSRWDLRSLILLLSLFASVVTLLNSFVASYRVQRQLLIDNTLEANHAYAAKLASSTEAFLQGALQQLGYSAQLIARRFDDGVFLAEEAERLRLETDSFNSVVIADDSGRVKGVSPESLGIQGKQLNSLGAQTALHERRPLVSSPYLSVANNLVVFISHPVIDGQGKYLGYVGGTIYLKQRSVLNELLGEHYYKDGSYLYVVDASQRLLYHPDVRRIGTQVAGNALLDHLAELREGTQRVVNSAGIDMLAGFASVPTAGWGIVAQRPTERTLEVLNELMLSMLLKTLPLAALSFLLIWWLARIIASPLRQLAASARVLDEAGTAERIEGVRSWYFESSELKRAMLLGLGLLHERIGRLTRDVQTDPLTGLSNRRALELALTLWRAEQRPFAVVALDIDHFKRVNDTYGHDIGDRVLQTLAELMRSGSRGEDLLCRVGGEEFLMLLPGTSPETAVAVAERLRRLVEQTPVEAVGSITISLGVAHWPRHGRDPLQVLKCADEQLYAAKDGGRNRVMLAPPPDEQPERVAS